DVSHGHLVRLPWDYHLFGLSAESQTVADAVRLSMSIPFFYEAVRMAGSWFVDGGLLSNFPVDTFDRHDDQPPRWPTFGIKLSARPEANQVEYEVEGVVSLTKAMIGTMLNAHDQMHLDAPGVLARTIFVDTDKVKATDFAIDAATQELLYQNGRRAATRFLQTWDFAKYLQTYRS
ncbi:MAG: patatin-like phospholipase family protein, partial [Acidimicrobiales bacterium]